MNGALFQDLLDSFREADAIRRHEQPADRSHRYVGQVLVEEREQGEAVWTLADAAEALSEQDLEALDARSIREALRQTQEGFAELLGVSVGTLRGWEQGRRQPRGPARRLLQVAARHPMAVLETVVAA